MTFEAMASIFPCGWEYTEDHKGLVVTRTSFESLADGRIVLDQSFPAQYGFNVTISEFINITQEQFYTIRWNVLVMIVEAGTYKHTLMHNKLFTLAITNNGFPYVDDDNDGDYEPTTDSDSCISYSDYETSEGSDGDDDDGSDDDGSVYDTDSMEQ